MYRRLMLLQLLVVVLLPTFLLRLLCDSGRVPWFIKRLTRPIKVGRRLGSMLVAVINIGIPGVVNCIIDRRLDILLGSLLLINTVLIM